MDTLDPASEPCQDQGTSKNTHARPVVRARISRQSGHQRPRESLQRRRTIQAPVPTSALPRSVFTLLLRAPHHWCRRDSHKKQTHPSRAWLLPRQQGPRITATFALGPLQESPPIRGVRSCFVSIGPRHAKTTRAQRTQATRQRELSKDVSNKPEARSEDRRVLRLITRGACAHHLHHTRHPRASTTSPLRATELDLSRLQASASGQ